MSKKHLFKIKLRRDIGVEVTPAMDEIDGKNYYFSFGWRIPADHPDYPDEIAWVPEDEKWPSNAPVWMSNEDMLRIPGVSL